jgi:hypothetical protein
VSGKWVMSRRGYHYEQAVWTEREGRWNLTRGTWRAGNRNTDGFANPPAVAPSSPKRP